MKLYVVIGFGSGKTSADGEDVTWHYDDNPALHDYTALDCDAYYHRIKRFQSSTKNFKASELKFESIPIR